MKEDIYWVPANILGKSKYTNEEIENIIKLDPEEKQEKITTLYEAIQLYQLSNFKAHSDNIRIREDNINWEHHKPGYYAVETNEGCCATSSNWLNYILKDDYDEVGFIAYSQENGSGHILNYIKEDEYYYIIDMTHYRTDFFENNGIETGDLEDYYKRDFIGDNIHKVKKLEDYAKYCVDKFNDPPVIFFTYTNENCLPLDSKFYNGETIITYPNNVDVKILYAENNAKQRLVDPPKEIPNWEKRK